jgi:hypothetical protein
LEQVPTLVVNYEKLMDSANASNAFNNFFITVTEKLNILHIQKVDAISILNYSFPGNFLTIITISITESEIKNIIHSLKPIKIRL